MTALLDDESCSTSDPRTELVRAADASRPTGGPVLSVGRTAARPRLGPGRPPDGPARPKCGPGAHAPRRAVCASATIWRPAGDAEPARRKPRLAV